MTRRILWGIGSGRAFRVHWTLQELGLKYETKPVRTRTPAMDMDTLYIRTTEALFAFRGDASLPPK